MPQSPHLNDLVAARLSRRSILGGLASLPLLSAAACATTPTRGAATRRPLGFASVAATRADRVTVPAGYTARTLIAWGDPLFDSDAEGVPVPALDLDALDRTQQELRFGTHNDMLALFPRDYSFPTPRDGRRHILCSNHEYFDPTLAFPSARSLAELTPARLSALFAAMGVGIVAVDQTPDGRWSTVRDARPGTGLNRRITPFTPVVFSGPAADHPWIRSAAEHYNAAEPGTPQGTVACGTLANCAGGQTPWGTYLTSEENFQSYFRAQPGNAAAAQAATADPLLAQDAEIFGYRLRAGTTPWPAPAAYDLGRNPHGAAVYGWVVEIDPYDPTSTPKKRTAIGRKKGENSATALARDGRVAVYQGDDQINEFVYKFVSAGRFDASDRRANMDLLDAGVLHVARFQPDGTGRWLPITLQAANAAAAQAGAAPFADDGDLMVRARTAARLLGGTPTDRPEDVEAMHGPDWIGTGQVFIPCTKGNQPAPAQPGRPVREGAEPDGQINHAGHVIRIDEDGGDCGATTFRWDIFLVGGDPAAEAATGTLPNGRPFLPSVAEAGRASSFSGVPLACPDNLCFDSAGHVWISTDGSHDVFGDCNDMVLVASTPPGAERPELRRFLVGPLGSEICGPTLSPDERTFLAAIQHPGEFDAENTDFGDMRWERPGLRPPSSFPDGGGAWPRSAVVYVVKDDGGVIGT